VISTRRAGAKTSSLPRPETRSSDSGTASVCWRTGGGPSYPRRERRAHDHLEDIPADKLVFGHTHAPYVHHANRVANPGSWKTTAPVHNTYLDIEAGDLELFRFHEDGPNDRLA